MKANKAKSKFVYPDKLYARCKDNKTLDISYAPQNMDAVEYTRTDSLIEKAWGFIEDNLLSSNQQDKSRLYYEQFKNYMKGE
jgi:hypothetical protein